MKLKECPKCKSELGDRWTSGHMLQQYCSDSNGEDCTWKAEPRTPELIPITPFKSLPIDDFYGWCYMTYDRYGHVSCYSNTYDTEAEATKEMADDMTRGNKDPKTNPAAPYTGVVFFVPHHTKIKGKMFAVVGGKVERSNKPSKA